MKLNKFILFCLIFSWLSAQEYKETISMTDIMSQGLSDIEDQQFFDMLESGLVNLGAFNVTTGNIRDKALKEVKFQQSGCVDQKCAAEVGAFLGANVMIIPNILFVKDKKDLTLTLKLVDVETASIKTTLRKEVMVTRIKELNNYLPDYLFELFIKYINTTPAKLPSDDKIGTLIINTTPEESMVYLNNNQMGNTLLELSDLGVGNYTVTLARKGYKVLVFQTEISEGKVKKLNKILIENSNKYIEEEELFEVMFNINMDGVYCSYNNFAPLLSSGEKTVFKLPQGKYNFYFSKDKFRTVEKEIILNSDQNITITLEEDIKQTIEYKPPGIITISSNPIGAEIIINGQKIGSTPFSSILTSGKHQLELRKNLYYTKTENFDLDAGETKNVTLNLSPQFGFLSVTSTLEDIDIFINGKGYGDAPLKEIHLNSGAHNINVRKKLYHDFVMDFEVFDGKYKSILVNPEPAFGKLTINSIPKDGAEVYLDGVRRGQTPFVLEQCLSGTYIVEIKMDDYNPVTEELVVRDKRHTLKTVILNPNVGTLVTSCEGCKLFLNEEVIGNHNSEKKLSAGRYIIRAEKPNFYPEEKEIIIVVGEKNNITFNLSPIMGSASVFVEPIGAQNSIIYINKKKEGPAPKVFTLPIGRYSINVKHPNFVETEKKFEIIENKNQIIKFNLLSYSGSIQQDIDRWEKRAFISLITGGICTLGGAYFNNASDSAYDSYLQSTSTADAVNFKQMVQDNNEYKNVMISIAATAAVNWGFSKLRSATYKEKLKKR